MSYVFTSTTYNTFIEKEEKYWSLPYMGRDLLEEYASLEEWIKTDVYLLSIKERVMEVVESEEPVITGYNREWIWSEEKKQYGWVSTPFWGIKIVSSIPLEEFVERIVSELAFTKASNEARREIFPESILPYLEGEEVEGTWLHVLNDRLELNRFKEYIENFLKIEGEICVSPLKEDNPYKCRRNGIAVILRGRCSFLWNRDVGSETLGNLRIPKQVHSEREEGWLIPSEAQFVGMVVEDEDLRYRLRQAGWKCVVHKFPGLAHRRRTENHDEW